MKRKPISAVLTKLRVGEHAVYPIAQRGSLNSNIYGSLSGYRSAGMKWSIKSNIPEGTVTVTRVK